MICLLGLGLFNTAIAYLIYFRILAVAGATNLSLVAFLIPISALFLGVFVLGERLDWTDFAGMALIFTGLADSATQQQIQQRLAQIQHNETHVVYVATLANNYVVGWAHAHTCDLIIMPTQAILFGLVVDEDHRHSGIGRLLMQHIEQWASLLGCQGVLFRSNVKRKEAHSFYEKIGYSNIKQSLTFYKTLI